MPGTPVGLVEIIHRCLRKEPATALPAHGRGEGLPGGAEGTNFAGSAAKCRPAPHMRPAGIAAIGLALAVFAIGGWFWRQSRNAAREYEKLLPGGSMQGSFLYQTVNSMYFMWITLFGAGMLTVSLVFGHGDHEVDDHGADHDADHGGNMSVLSLKVFWMFLVGFGAGGYFAAEVGSSVLVRLCGESSADSSWQESGISW